MMQMKTKTVVSLLFCVFLLICLSSCHKKEKTEKWLPDSIVYTYDDGSQIYYLGGDEYEHILFDGNKVCFLGFTAEWIDLEQTDFSFSIKDKSACTVESYAFSKAGYVAFHAYVISQETDAARYVWINSSPEPIEEELFSVLDLNKKTEHIFADYTALYAHCEQNGIELGERYICSPFKSEAEILTPLAADYSLVEYPYGLSALRKGQENLYFGKITDLQVTDSAISFQLKVPRNCYFPPASAQTNAELKLKDPNDFSFIQRLFGFDDLYKGDVTIPLSS